MANSVSNAYKQHNVCTSKMIVNADKTIKFSVYIIFMEATSRSRRGVVNLL